MRKQIKLTAIGLAAAGGLASAALAQQSAPRAEQSPRSQSGQAMGQGNGMMGGMMPMMNNPEMRQMMAKCNKMMDQMGNMPTAKPRT